VVQTPIPSIDGKPLHFSRYLRQPVNDGPGVQRFGSVSSRLGVSRCSISLGITTILSPSLPGFRSSIEPPNARSEYGPPNGTSRQRTHRDCRKGLRPDHVLLRSRDFIVGQAPAVMESRKPSEFIIHVRLRPVPQRGLHRLLSPSPAGIFWQRLPTGQRSGSVVQNAQTLALSA